MKTLKRWYVLITCRVICFTENDIRMIVKINTLASLFSRLSIFIRKFLFLIAVTLFMQWRQTSYADLLPAVVRGSIYSLRTAGRLPKVSCAWRCLFRSELSHIFKRFIFKPEKLLIVSSFHKRKEGAFSLRVSNPEDVIIFRNLP